MGRPPSENFDTFALGMYGKFNLSVGLVNTLGGKTMDNSFSVVDWMIKELIAIDALKPARLSGCTTEEIQQIMDGQGVQKLPPIYEYFLRKMGKKSGIFMSDKQLYFPDLVTLKDDATEILRNQYMKEFIFEPNMFVFWLTPMLEIMWFETVENPSVIFYWYELDEEITKINISLSDVFTNWTLYYQEVKEKVPSYISMMNKALGFD
ncbi:MAG: hypothetical protein MUF38_01135 [Anaerolineae bacterium]|jgi:hypothetical protein|nr:hypothetical protein [Anaerolineae bacterium]